MIPRILAREFREFPVTFAFCLLWVLVFAAMTCVQLAAAAPASPLQWLLLGFGGGGRFGDLTLDDLLRGQVWRLITCNFVHYSLLHIVLNILAMYLVGCIVESWYGPYQLVFIYGVTGAGGNLVSALIRLGIGSNRQIHSAGGSVVIMGFVALCAVAGWRSRTATGKWLSRQMAIILFTTAAVGLVLPNFIDNWGHTGGAVVGAAIGLGHHTLTARERRPSAIGDGVVTGLVMLLCAAAQVAEDRRDARAHLERSLIRHSARASRSAATLVGLRRVVAHNGRILGAAGALREMERVLGPSASEEIRRLTPLVRSAQARRLKDGERREFEDRVASILKSIRREYEGLQLRLARVQASRRIGPWRPPPAGGEGRHS